MKCCKPLKTCKSRELRGSILYTDCYCLRRNGLQYDCRRSGCQSSRLCQVLPAPLCEPANVACVKHCANPHAEPLCNICNMRCSPCGPMVCYKYEDCGPPKDRSADPSDSRAEESGIEKKEAKENQLKRTKSRELRGGIMYYSCHCIKRNGLQHDCRRTGCGGEPSCLVMPDPLCAPSQLARARGLADPAPLAAHYRAQGGGSGGLADSSTGSGTGKRFIVCELKGIVPDSSSSNKNGQCCKCPTQISNSVDSSAHERCISAPKATTETTNARCNCSCSCKQSPDSVNPMLMFDEETYNRILGRFQNKELAPGDVVIGPGGRPRKVKKTEVKDEPCTRPGCVHWKPPPPCLWDAPCKADCFEAHPGIQPGRNPLTGSGGSRILSVSPSENTGKKFVMLTPLE